MATEKIKLLTENVLLLKSQHKPQTVVTKAINELKHAMAEHQETVIAQLKAQSAPQEEINKVRLLIYIRLNCE